jgi:hypothetical protein
MGQDFLSQKFSEVIQLRSMKRTFGNYVEQSSSQVKDEEIRSFAEFGISRPFCLALSEIALVLYGVFVDSDRLWLGKIRMVAKIALNPQGQASLTNKAEQNQKRITPKNAVPCLKPIITRRKTMNVEAKQPPTA